MIFIDVDMELINSLLHPFCISYQVSNFYNKTTGKKYSDGRYMGMAKTLGTSKI